MTNKHNTLPIDEKLAQFTDRLLDGDTNEMVEDDVELAAFADTVKRLHAAFDEAIPENKALQIQKKLKANWLHIPRSTSRAQLKRTKWLSWTTQGYFRTAASVALILVLVILAPTLLSDTPNMAGNAGLFTQKTLLLTALGLVLAVILIWTQRKK